MNRQRGQAIVEFALVLPLLLVLVMGIIDFGLVIQQYLGLEHSARAGARLASTGASLSAVSARVGESIGWRWSSEDLTVIVISSDQGDYSEVTVTVRAPVHFVTPLASLAEGLSPSWEAQASASFRVE